MSENKELMENETGADGSNATVIKLSVDDDAASVKKPGGASPKGTHSADNAKDTNASPADAGTTEAEVENVAADEVWDEKARKEIEAEREAREIEALEAAARKREEDIEKAEETATAIKEAIKETAKEEDSSPMANISLKKILGGDFLTAQFVRSQIWLILLITFFTVVYIANRYACQQCLIEIDRLEKELKDAKYKALTSASQLTEKCRESKVLDMLKTNEDSVLHIANQPPFIIIVPEE